MAQPSPIFVTPSTTVVKVVPLQTPYTPVILNAYSYAGQVVSVLDGTSSFGVVQTPVVLSTAATTFFSDGSISTLINQPQGYVTLQAQSPNVWNYLNSFPFRNQYLSAGVLNLTTSTLQVAVLSTLQEYTSSLRVENLIVSGNVSQSSPITINTSVSTLGSVDLYSSFTAWGPAFVSSGLSVGGQVRLTSTLQLLGNFTTPNPLRFLSTTYVSGSVLTLGPLSSPLVNLSGNLDTYTLVVQQSTLTSVIGAATLQVNQLLALSTLTAGGDFQSYKTVATNVSTMSSMAIRDSLAVAAATLVQGSFSTQGGFVLSTLSAGTDTLIQGKLLASDLYVGGFLTLSSQVSTLDFQAGSAFVRGNLQVNPFLPNITSVQDIVVGKSFGVGSLTSLSTTIGSLSTPSFALIQGALYGESSFRSRLEISTLSSVSTLGDIYVLGAFSTLNDVSISGSLVVYKDLNVFSTSYWNQSNLSASHIVGDLSILGDLTVTQTLKISTFVLPSSVTANNFQVSTLFVGYKGIVNAVGISSLVASSIATGGLTNAAFTMDMANPLQTYTLSTFLLSTLEFAAQSDGPVSYSTCFQATSSLGVQTTASTNTIDVKTLAYTLCNVYVGKRLSTNTLYGDTIVGTLFGDGTLLTNVQFPARLSTGIVTTSTLQSKVINASTFLTSTMTADLFVTYSTLTVNQFSVYGNANQDLFLQSTFLQTIQSSSNLVKLNPIYAYGDPAGLVFKQVVINSNLLADFNTTSYTLGVGNSLRANYISSPGFSMPLEEYRADIVVTQLAGTISVQNIYVSSGLIGLSSGSFFLPETAQLLARSTNTIQPSLSTLQFNSTLFVTADRQAVGINTFPTYTLDVKGTAYAPSNFVTTASTIVRDQLTVRQVQTPLWYGTGVYSEGISSNIRYSSDGETWFASTDENDNYGLPLCNIAYDGGRATIDVTNQTQGYKTWVATGQIGVLYKVDSGPWTKANVRQTVKKTALTNVAFNGEYWVMTSYNPTNLAAIDPVATVMWSLDGSTWENSETGGFGWDNVTSNHGGRGVAWNGSLWVAVGLGSSPLNSIVTSGDGSNWTSAASGGFAGTGGYGVVWTGCNWVAVGDGGYNRSFTTSSNGIDWPISIGYGFDGVGNAIAWNGSRLVAVGAYSAGYPSILYSDTYGATWENATGTLFDVFGAEGKTVVWNGSYWLAGGTTGIRKSYDGKTWFQPAASPSYPFTGLAWTSNALPSLIVGDPTVKSYSTSNITALYVGVGQDVGLNTIATSSNGVDWVAAASGAFWGSGRGVAFNGTDRWIAVGDGAFGTSNILYSGDAQNWSNAVLLDPGDLGVGNGVAYGVYLGTGYWASCHSIAFSGQPTQFYSLNGSTWYNSAGAQFDVAAYAVAVSDTGQFVCVGQDTTSGNTLRWAPNREPTGWSGNDVTNMFTTAGYGIAYGGGLWVAVGNDTGPSTMKYSTDFKSWSDATGSIFTSIGFGVAYDGVGLWVAVGDSGGGGGTIKYSTDGMAWSASVSGEFPTTARGVTYNKGAQLWVVTGNLDGSSCFKYSGDGMNWSNGSGGFQITGYGVTSTSNIQVTSRSYYDQVRFIKNPGPAVLARQATPYISYTSTLMDLNNVVLFDTNANVIVGTSSISHYTSTFYEPGPAFISGYVSTTGMTLNAGFYLGMQNV
jgi:hypothetical protein